MEQDDDVSGNDEADGHADGLLSLFDDDTTPDEDETDAAALVWDADTTVRRKVAWVSTALRLAPAFRAETVDDEKAFEAAVAAVVGYSLVELQRQLTTQHRQARTGHH